VTVEFPAYSAQVNDVRDALRGNGFNPQNLEVSAGLTLAGGC
jgi:hypothetical protein